MLGRLALTLLLGMSVVACADQDKSETAWADTARRDCPHCVDIESLPGLHGAVHARYLILSAVYTPPGSKQCRDNGSIQYGPASRLGTTASIRGIFREDVQVRAVVPERKLLLALVDELDVPESDPSALSIGKSRNVTLGFHGACEEGFDRQKDSFLVWFQPRIQLAIQGDEVTWTIDSSKIETKMMAVSDLEPYTSIDTTLPESLRKYDFHSYDVAQILTANPLLSDKPVALDPQRFIPWKRVEYASREAGEQDLKLSHLPVPADAATLDYAVKFEVEGNDAFQDKLRSLMVDPERWKWTLSNAGAAWSGDGELVTLHMGSASSEYDGPPIIATYFDTLFQSFAFVAEDRE